MNDIEERRSVLVDLNKLNLRAHLHHHEILVRVACALEADWTAGYLAGVADALSGATKSHRQVLSSAARQTVGRGIGAQLGWLEAPPSERALRGQLDAYLSRLHSWTPATQEGLLRLCRGAR